MVPDLAADAAALASPVRQSPFAVLQIAFTHLRQIGTVNLVIGLGFVVSGRFPSWAFALVPLGGLLLLAAAVASWWRFTFRVTMEELVVTQGVLYTKELVIPFAKVQSVTVNEGVMQRAFGLVSASVDTAGSAAAEFQIQGIERGQAEALRRLASRANPALGSTAPDPSGSGLDDGSADLGERVPDDRSRELSERVLVERNPRELMLLGLISNPFAGLALVMGAGFFADDLAKMLSFDLPSFEEPEAVSGRLIAVVAVLVVAALALAWLGLGLRNVVVNWNFRLTSRQQGLELSAGLLGRRVGPHVTKRRMEYEAPPVALHHDHGLGRCETTL